MRRSVEENEDKREYRIHQKVEAGEKLAGDLAADLDDQGGVGRVRADRSRYVSDRKE